MKRMQVLAVAALALMIAFSGCIFWPQEPDLAGKNLTEISALGIPVECTQSLKDPASNATLHFIWKVNGGKYRVDYAGAGEYAGFASISKNGITYTTTAGPLMRPYSQSGCDWIYFEQNVSEVIAFFNVKAADLNCTRDDFGDDAFNPQGVLCTPLEALNHTSQTPTPTPSGTPIPPGQTPVECPSACLYGCIPGSSDCAAPVCSASCAHGCVSGTTTCFAVQENLSMNNTNFERGTYEGWTTFGNAFTLFTGQTFTPHGPKDVIRSNEESSYYESPYTDYQGRYIASSFPDKRTTGGLISRQFTINRDYLEFLAIGAEDNALCVGLKIADTIPDATCIELQNDPSTVRYYTPKPPVQTYAHFTRISWDVSEFKGQQGVIEVIDGSTTWFFEVDDFRQNDTATGVLLQTVTPSYYPCNHNTVCETGLGETDQWCSDDCPQLSSCRVSGAGGGLVDYTLTCYSFKLTRRGLALTLNNTGYGRNHTITLLSIKCSAESNPDPSSYAQVNKMARTRETIEVSNGTMPCYDSQGESIYFTPGMRFGGKLFYSYRDEETNYTWNGGLGFNAVTQPE